MSARNQEHVSLNLGGLAFEVVSLQGRQMLSRPFTYNLVCRAAADGKRPVDLLGSNAEVRLRDGFGGEQCFTGFVADAAIETFDHDGATIRLGIRPEIHPLTLGRGCRVFQDSSVVDIAQAILAGRRFRLALTRDYPVRVYTAQYREDDWTFLCRLLEEEGIYFWFDHENPTTLVLADDSTAAPDLEGGAYVPFHYETGMHADTEMIQALASEGTTVPTKFTVSSFDPARPTFRVKASEGEGPFEIYHAPGGGSASTAICAARAKTLAEAAVAMGYVLTGTSTSVRLVPGMVLEVRDHPLGSLNGRFFVTSVVHEVAQRLRVQGRRQHFTCQFRAIPAKTFFRPSAESPKAKQSGLQTGVVVGPIGSEIHTHPTGAVRVQHHWDREGRRDEKSGKWMRVAQRGTASSQLYPRTGWSVVTFNEEGAIDAPNVLSRIFDGEHLPPYGLPANKTRVVFKTAMSPGGGLHNEIYFEDKLGGEEMFIHASKDHNVLVRNIKRESVMHDSSRKVGVDHDLTVGESKTDQVKENHDVTIGARETTVICAGGSKTVQGNESTVVAGSRKIHATSESLQVTKTRKLRVGGALIDITFGTESAGSSGTHTMLVGGVALKMSAKTISEDVGKVAIQTVGGAKLEFSGANRLIDVRKNLVETVGGMMLLNTNGTHMDHADETSTWLVGGSLQENAPEVFIEGRKKIVIRCGASSIVITENTIELNATSLNLSNCQNLHTATQLIEHNP